MVGEEEKKIRKNPARPYHQHPERRLRQFETVTLTNVIACQSQP
jgi:hypothetical protein